ncbi:Rrf2 family transcriptional regulator [Desulfosporosinus sp. PR]|uniref:RrF2 family transcriptional regulator n=1 Tax=Candidatus Desulfosporosinus nitrosoreducens TaxID=3401928 RepID=UPI0027EF9659|nr:Rrf2 family transcriptional regulator [Desulfosporosinus sp. PR]MDQ7092877.1 Rrf2 family transcriptional regulator [Desulfosporosinus sp. PR]
MQFSIGVEYALHSLFYMVDLPLGKAIGVRELATLQGISETYLSKVFTKLRKAGIVRAMPGVNGGYELARNSEAISLWDIVEAVEGASPIFQCAEIRQNNILVDKNAAQNNFEKCPCLIKVIMLEAEEQMRRYLAERSLAWLNEEAKKEFTEEKKKAINAWLKNIISK